MMCDCFSDLLASFWIATSAFEVYTEKKSVLRLYKCRTVAERFVEYNVNDMHTAPYIFPQKKSHQKPEHTQSILNLIFQKSRGYYSYKHEYPRNFSKAASFHSSKSLFPATYTHTYIHRVHIRIYLSSPLRRIFQRTHIARIYTAEKCELVTRWAAATVPFPSLTRKYLCSFSLFLSAWVYIARLSALSLCTAGKVADSSSLSLSLFTLGIYSYTSRNVTQCTAWAMACISFASLSLLCVTSRIPYVV